MALKPTTSTYEVLQAYRGKTDLLIEWEEQPVEYQAQEAEYIADLTRRIRQLSVYISHRRDAPI